MGHAPAFGPSCKWRQDGALYLLDFGALFVVQRSGKCVKRFEPGVSEKLYQPDLTLLEARVSMAPIATM